MAINPVYFAHAVCDEFLRYIFSAFPLSDPDLAHQVRSMLKRPSSLDMPLVQGPYISLSESFAKGPTVQELAQKGILHASLPGLIEHPTLWKHQQQVLESVRAGRHVLVSTGTGSGKTESFLYPIVDDLLRQRDKGVTTGLTALLVYPMNALANDQLDRLRDFLGGTGVTFAQWVGTTPRTESEVVVERFEGSSREAYLKERNKRRKEALGDNRTLRALAPPEECCTEEEIRTRQPRILITNYRQLEILTTREDVKLFASSPLRYMVFDEAHTYTGATGAEVACLVRRLRVLANKSADEILCIGTSATLTDPGGGGGDKPAKRFASRFFGVDEEKVNLVGESYVSREWPDRRYRPIAPHGDGMERLNRVLKALAEPFKQNAFKKVVEELTGQIFDPGKDWQEALFGHLITNEYLYQCAQMLRRPGRLDEVAWQTSEKIAPGRLDKGDFANAEMLTYLILGAAAKKNGESLIRPKVHFFIRGLDEMVAALEGATTALNVQLFMSTKEAKEKYDQRRDDAFFAVRTCTHCGQHFFEKKYQNLALNRNAKNRVSALANGDAAQGGTVQKNAVWTPTADIAGTRVICTDRLLEDADAAATGQSQKWLSGWFCRQCGAMHREPNAACLADGCNHAEELLPLIVFGDRLASCPTCGSLSHQIGGRTIEPARAIRAVPVADVHILAQSMISAAPEGHQKLIIFADSRQDAAFQAGWMQDHARRIRFRHLMYQIILESRTALSFDEIIDGLMQKFRATPKLADTLLPELTGDEAAAVFGMNKWKPILQATRYMVIREFSTARRRRDCLESMGLAVAKYEGLNAAHPKVQEFAATLDRSPEETLAGIEEILDAWRRARMLWVKDDPIYSKYRAKDDPFVQTGLLPLREFKPEGLVLNPAPQNTYARSVIAKNKQSSLQTQIKKWAAHPQTIDVDAAAVQFWELVTEHLKLLTKVTLRKRNDTPLGGDVWQVEAKKIVVRSSNEQYRCTRCQQIIPRPTPQNKCPAFRCPGELVRQEPDQENYDIWIMGRPFVMVNAEEHTAQVPGEVRNLIENDFKSATGMTNCLVATPTLELGVNIGALDMALMKNVPPRPSNYWQRAGRAGREERMAVVITYCNRTSHDRYYFDDPLRLLDGAIEPPAFNLQNPLMVAKHIRSALISELVLRVAGGDGEIQQVLAAMFPAYVRDYLLDKDDHFRPAPLETTPLRTLLESLQPQLAPRLIALFSKHWPEEAKELATPQAIEACISNTADELDTVLLRLHSRLTWAQKTRQDIHRKKDRGLVDKEQEQLLRRCDEYINSIIRREASTYTLSVLGNEGFLPGYGSYEGGIAASARRGFARFVGPKTFDLSRSKTVALREFVPGNRLYANRGSFFVSRYHLAADESSKLRPLLVKVDKGYVIEKNSASGYGQSGCVEILALPLADCDLAQENRITDEENLRFSMPSTILGRLRNRCRGGAAYHVDTQDIHHLHGQGIELVNLGEAGRVKTGTLGHLICSACGAAKSPYAVPAEVAHFTKIHKERCGRDPQFLALSASTEVDMLQFHHLSDNAKAVNIGEAIRAAAIRLMDMGQNDLLLLLITHPDERLDLILFDTMPGGSGLLEQLLGRWKEVIKTAKELLNGCPQQCDTACYDCLKTYQNQVYHELLNRHEALEHLDALDFDPVRYQEIGARFEEEPGGTGTPSNPPEARLQKFLVDAHFPPGEYRKRITTSLGLWSEPDWLYEPKKVAVYIDGMSKGLHGDPKMAKKDQIVRSTLEYDGYTVVVIQTKDLNDPEAMRGHLENLGKTIGL